jgi:hypothetical protein
MFYDKRLPQAYEDLLRMYEYSPHPDAAVLHPPGTCLACDFLPELSEYRLTHGVPFTGLPDALGAVCWSERDRNLSMIYKWAGNRPVLAPAPPTDGQPVSSRG